MTFQEQLVERALAIHQQKKGSPQAILDSQYFKDLPLEDKRDFIERHKDYLKQAPRYNWGGVGIGSFGASAFAGLGTVLHQISASSAKGVKLQPIPIVAALGAGAIVGGILNISKSKADYNRDRQTQRNIDDVIHTMVLRGMSAPASRSDVVKRMEEEVEKVPLTYGKVLSSVDWDEIRKRDAENYAKRQAQEKGE